jgi:hypothetical protein
MGETVNGKITQDVFTEYILMQIEKLLSTFSCWRRDSLTRHIRLHDMSEVGVFRRRLHFQHRDTYIEFQ